MLRVQFERAALLGVIAKVGAVGSTAWWRDLDIELAKVALAQVDLGFEQSQDPAGHPWAPLKGRPGKPLVRTGDLRRSFGSEVQGKGVVIGSALRFAGYLQEGTSRIPARPMVPEGELSPAWARALEDVADTLIGKE